MKFKISSFIAHGYVLFSIWLQVDAALTTDPVNEELLKLKNDLQEVIDLTKELLAQTQSLPSGDHGKFMDMLGMIMTYEVYSVFNMANTHCHLKQNI